MSADQPDHQLYTQAKAILQRVFELPPAERGAYLESACGDQPALRAEVFSLLAAHEQINSQFLDNPFTVDGDEVETGADERDLSGQRVGAYKLERLIGRGGMGAVYLASRDDGEFKKHVAIKFIRSSMVTPALLKRFKAERQILADIDHPNIARLIDGGTVEGMPFFIMEYVPGETLTHVLEGGPLPLAQVLKLATAVADVLELVHAKGLVFRDLKPANIMLTETSSVKVLDFGIAKITRDDTGERPTALTEPGWIVGSPRYMSPEQASGEGVDARSDVFSFGVVIFEALTGRLPFSGDVRRDYLKNLISAAPAPLPPEVPGNLRAIVERCLARNPAERFASGRELAQAVHDLDRRPVGWGLRAAIAVLALALTGLVVWSALRPKAGDSALLKVPPQLIATSASDERYPRFSPDMRRISFISDRDGVDKIFVRELATGNELSIEVTGDVVGQEWAPTSDQIVYLSRAQQWKFTVVPIPTGPPRSIVLTETDVALIRWIREGIYYKYNGSVWRFDLAIGSSRQVTTNLGSLRIRTVDVSADERQIVFSAMKDGTAFLWSAAIDGSHPVRLTDERMDPKVLRWKGAAAREVVYVSEEAGMCDIWELDVTSHGRQRLTENEAREAWPDVSQDGKTLIYEQVSAQAHVYVLDPEEKPAALKRLTSDSLGDLFPSASSSGKEIAFQRSKTRDLSLGMADATIQLSHNGLGDPSEKIADGSEPEISPDGQWLAYTVPKPSTTSELWLVNLRTRHRWLITDTLLQTGNTPFPALKQGTNVAWSPTECRLFFIESPSLGHGRIASISPLSGDQPPPVLRFPDILTDVKTVTDIHVSGDGAHVSFLTMSTVRGLYELHVWPTTRKEGKDEGVLYSETTAFSLSSLGWVTGPDPRKADGPIVVVRDTVDHVKKDVLLVFDRQTQTEMAQNLRNVDRFSFALDPRKGIVYYVITRGTAPSLYSVSSANRQPRLVYPGEPHGSTFSGLRVLEDGRLLFSYQQQNSDIVANTFVR